MEDSKLNWLMNDSNGHKIGINGDIFCVVGKAKRNGETNLVVEDFYETLMFLPFSLINDYEIID